MTRFSPLVADAGALAACASTQPVSTSPPPIWTTPEWKAEPAARKEQSAALLKKWNYCAIDQARERALTDLPALVAVARAFESYKGEREEWVLAQISPGISRDMAEDVALRAQNNLVPLVRDYVMDIRAARAAKRSDKGQPADTTAYSRPEAALSSDAVMFRWSDCTVYKAADFARDDSSVEEAVERSLRACAPARAEYARKLAALAEPGDEIIAGTETRLRTTLAKLVQSLREKWMSEKTGAPR